MSGMTPVSMVECQRPPAVIVRLALGIMRLPSFECGIMYELISKLSRAEADEQAILGK